MLAACCATVQYFGVFFCLQASLQEFVISESDPGPARLILYSNLPPTCQGTRGTNPYNCWIRLKITSSTDVALRQRLPGGVILDSPKSKSPCVYHIFERDWKLGEGFAYDSNRSLDIVAKVGLVRYETIRYDTRVYRRLKNCVVTKHSVFLRLEFKNLNSSYSILIIVA